MSEWVDKNQKITEEEILEVESLEIEIREPAKGSELTRVVSEDVVIRTRPVSDDIVADPNRFGPQRDDVESAAYHHVSQHGRSRKTLRAKRTDDLESRRRLGSQVQSRNYFFENFRFFGKNFNSLKNFHFENFSIF